MVKLGDTVLIAATVEEVEPDYLIHGALYRVRIDSSCGTERLYVAEHDLQRAAALAKDTLTCK